MIDPATTEIIRQKKADALAAKHLHAGRRAPLDNLNRFVDAFAIAVPIAYFAIRLLAKGTSFQSVVEVIWEILAAGLLVVAALKMTLHWPGKAQEHTELMGENISLVREADNILNDPNPSPERAQAFLNLADRIEKADRRTLSNVADSDRHAAYREALKEFSPGHPGALCPICDASPWNFQPGSCQACGNTPARKQAAERITT